MALGASATGSDIGAGRPPSQESRGARSAASWASEGKPSAEENALVPPRPAVELQRSPVRTMIFD